MKAFGFANRHFAIIAIALIAALINFQHMNQYGTSPNNCDSVLKYGRYIHDTDDHPTGWQPDGCSLKQYSHRDLHLCLGSGDEVIFYGDSTARQAFWGFVNTLFGRKMQTLGAHYNMPFISDGVKVQFIWDAYLNDTGLAVIHDMALNGDNSKEKVEAHGYNQDPNYKPKTYLYVAGGAWFAYTEEPSQVAEIYKRNLESLLNVIDNRVEGAFEAVYLGAPLIPFYSLLSPGRRDKLTQDQFGKMIGVSDFLLDFERTNKSVASPFHPTLQPGGIRYRTREGYTSQVSAYYVPVVNELGAGNHVALYDDILVHYTESTYLLHGSILINHMCNQRVVDATKKPLAGGSCCVKFNSLSGPSLAKALRVFPPILFLVLAAHGFHISRHLAKSLGLVIGVIGAVSFWAYVSNQTHFISKTSISFSSVELTGFLQVWVVVSLLCLSKYSSEQQQHNGCTETPYWLSQTFLKELQGICVSLFLIIQFTGARELVETFDFEILARVLISIWSMSYVYDLGFVVQDKIDSIKSLKRAYLETSPHFAKTLARVLTLPLLLSANVTDTVGTNLLPGSSPQSYRELGVKMFFWTLFVYIVFPPCVRYHQWQGLVFWGASCFVWFALSSVALIRTDFWAIALAGFSVLIPHSQSFPPLKANALARLKFSLLALCTIAVIMFLVLVNLVRATFSYFIFKNPNGLNNPPAYIELHMDIFNEYLNQRGHGYTSAVHSGVVFVAAICYVTLRLGILRVTQVESSNGGSSRSLYVSGWVFLGAFSYEILELYPYVFLAASGTLRLHYFPTGVVNSSLVTQTLYFVDGNASFPYFQWRVWEKVRKCASVRVAVGVLSVCAQVCASVWKNAGWSKDRNEETCEFELESQKA